MGSRVRLGDDAVGAGELPFDRLIEEFPLDRIDELVATNRRNYDAYHAELTGLPSLLFVIGGFAVVFFAAGLWLVRRLGGYIAPYIKKITPRAALLGTK